MLNATGDAVVFADKALERRFRERAVPFSTFYEAYLDGAFEIPGDLVEFLTLHRRAFSFRITGSHVRWALTRLLPEVAIHSRAQDRRIVREHYDRGNDFFGWFLGDRMVYTSAIFESPADTLEQAQDHKMDRVCRSLRLQPGARLLDVGCGWGTLVLHAARDYGADATGVTIAERQTSFGNERIGAAGLGSRARIVCQDYREIPARQFDAIACLEMVEHVGIKNVRRFYKLIYERLADDGRFFLQWTGLRRRLRAEDLIWAMFMSRYIFPGADASLPPGRMIAAMESAGFEIQSVTNVSPHYVATIERWHANWTANRSPIVAAYGERWYRLWRFFLAWSIVIGPQGTAACFQVVANKNLNSFDRRLAARPG